MPMLKYLPRQLFLSCLLSLGLFVSAPAQAGDWDDWIQSLGDWWNRERPEAEDDSVDIYTVLMFVIASGFFVEGGSQ